MANLTIRSLMFYLFLVFLLGNSHHAQAQSSTPRADIWATDGTVRAIYHTADTVYIGGLFTMVGPNDNISSGVLRTNIAALDIVTGQATTWNPGALDNVWDIISDGAGGMYIAGEFPSMNGPSRGYIAHFLPDGSLDTTWDARANGPVYAMALDAANSTIYVGGKFTSIGRQSRNNIAALYTTTGNALEWNPDAPDLNPSPNGGVRALAISGTTIYVGGYFPAIGGQFRNQIAALDMNSTGTATAWNPVAGGNGIIGPTSVWNFVESGSTIYTGGDFGGIGAGTQFEGPGIAELDTITGFATAWSPATNFYTFIASIKISGSTAYVGGKFFNIGGQTRNNIAALDITTGNATAWDPNASGGQPFVWAIDVSNTAVYIGGGFTTIGGNPRGGFAQFDLP